MLARINGGNSGIREYLENGLKQGREYGRDDLDNRLILDGNLDHLDNVINSIEDNGQNRYLHITLSFAEDDITPETLKAVTEDYKNLLMTAYHEDEFCFYAEAHLPKIKNLTNESTGEVYERKPHIHIVLPRKNIITDKSLNPIGNATTGHTIDKLDAIQEHINNKYNLASPKDSIRVSDNNHANVLSRYKGDFFKGRESAVKKEIFNDLDAKNIKTEKDFLDNLSRYGEVKTYNKGKANQYHAVKLEGNDKFTRLKSPLFSEQYITRRELPHVKPTAKEIEKNLSQWLEKTSHEIKHIHPSSPKNRAAYKAATDDQKIKILSIVREKYNDRYNLTDNRNQERDRTLSARGLIERGFKLSRQQPNAGLTPERLPSLQERHMVHQLRGYRRPETNKSDIVLPAHERRNMAEVRQGRQSDSGAMRWSSSDNRRITSSIQQDIHDITHKPQAHDLEVMREIRSKIDPQRFLSYCADKYKIKPSSHSVTFAKDGSPRFNAGKTNLNASDFLTKHLKIDWQEAKNDLIKIYDHQKNNIPFNKGNNNTFIRDKINNRTNHLVNKIHYQELRQLNRSYRTELFKISRINDFDKREVERGFAMFNYLKASDKLNTITAARSIAANQIIAAGEGNKMAEIHNADRDFSFTKSMEKKRLLMQYQTDIDKGIKLTDLVSSKKDKEVIYLDKKTQKEVFTDKGGFLQVPDANGKEKMALALEYAEKKFGGKLELKGTEQFKITAAITAAEKGMNIILSPDKYHQMMLDHAEKMKQEAAPQPENNANSIQQGKGQTATAEQQAEPIKNVLKAEESPHLEKIREVVFLRDALANDALYRNSIMNEQQTQKMEAATDNYLTGDRDLNKFDTAKAEIHAEIIKKRTGTDISVDDLKQDIKNSTGKTQDADAQQRAVKAAVEATPNPATPSQLKEAVEQGSKQGATIQEPQQSAIEKMAIADLNAVKNNQIMSYEVQLKSDASPEYAQALAKHQDIAKASPQHDVLNDIKLMAQSTTFTPIHALKEVEQRVQGQGFDLTNVKTASEARQPQPEAIKAAVEATPNPATPSQLKEAVEQGSKQTSPTVDGKPFNQLVVIPVNENNGFTNSASFKVGFVQDDRLVTELKNVKESDLNRMGIDTKGIDMRNVSPINVQTHTLKSPSVETPLKHAERKLNEFNASLINKRVSHDEYAVIKEQRAKLESNVTEAKNTIKTEEPKQEKTSTNKQDKGMSM